MAASILTKHTLLWPLLFSGRIYFPRYYVYDHDEYNSGEAGLGYGYGWHSFEHFYADMGDHPGKGYSLDRKDNDRNYEPGNCRWATAKEQARNTNRNIYVTHEGETLTLSAWAERLGINYWTMHDRYRRGKRGAALLVPLDHRKSNARTNAIRYSNHRRK